MKYPNATGRRQEKYWRELIIHKKLERMNCPKFEILRGTEKRGDVYISGAGQLSRMDKLRIRLRLNLTLSEDLTFHQTGEEIDDSRLPKSPSFCTLEDNIARFWVYPIDEPLSI